MVSLEVFVLQIGFDKPGQDQCVSDLGLSVPPRVNLLDCRDVEVDDVMTNQLRGLAEKQQRILDTLRTKAFDLVGVDVLKCYAVDGC